MHITNEIGNIRVYIKKYLSKIKFKTNKILIDFKVDVYLLNCQKVVLESKLQLGFFWL